MPSARCKYLSFNVIKYYVKLEKLMKLNKLQVPNFCLRKHALQAAS